MSNKTKWAGLTSLISVAKAEAKINTNWIYLLLQCQRRHFTYGMYLKKSIIIIMIIIIHVKSFLPVVSFLIVEPVQSGNPTAVPKGKREKQ